MKKNVHDIDDLFQSAYEKFEEEPSDQVWDKIKGSLNEKDRDRYRVMFVWWKRVAVVLLVLLGGLIAYELEIKNHAPEQTKNTRSEIAHQMQPVLDTRDKPLTKDRLTETSIALPNGHIAEKKSLPLKAETSTVGGQWTPKATAIMSEKKLTIHKPYRSIAASTGNDEALQKDSQDEIPQLGMRKVFSLKNRHESVGLKRSSASCAVVLSAIPQVKPLLSVTAGGIQGIKKTAYHFKSSWQVLATAYGDWTQYHLDNDDTHSAGGNAGEQKDNIDNREQHEVSFSAGVFVTRQQTKNLGIKTGLLFSNTEITIAPQELYATQEAGGSVAYKFVASSGYGYVKPGFGSSPAIGDSIQSSSAQHNLKTLSVPLMISYTLHRGRLAIVPSAGISANLITSAVLETEIANALDKERVIINKLEGMRKLYWGFAGEINVAYQHSKRWAIHVVPGIRYAITPITKGNVVKTYPYSLFAGAGITYRL